MTTTITGPEPIVGEGLVIHCSAEEWQSPVWKADVLALAADVDPRATWDRHITTDVSGEQIEALIEVFATRSRIEALLVAMRRCGWSASLHVTR